MEKKRKIVLLGDSIRQIGYGKKLGEVLGDGYEVLQPADNCRFAKYTMVLLRDMKDILEGADIIHWNNGIWDASEFIDENPLTSIDEYVSDMLRLAALLKANAKKVIFATSTMHKRGNERKNKRIQEYNAAIVPKLREIGVIINDLHTYVMSNAEEYICDDTVHLNELGIQKVAEHVAKLIVKECEDI